MERRLPTRCMVLRTGQHCLQSGWWAQEDDDTALRFILEGSLMPAIAGLPGQWRFVLSERPPIPPR
ncbi:hypothetical protein [Sinomonas soli]